MLLQRLAKEVTSSRLIAGVAMPEILMDGAATPKLP